jgi:hypothetical protein
VVVVIVWREVAAAVKRAVWTRVGPVAGQVLDLLHARVTEPYAPHLHEEFAVGACTDGMEVIRYRGARHYAGPGSVVILEPGEPHTGEPADASGAASVMLVVMPGGPAPGRWLISAGCVVR